MSLTMSTTDLSPRTTVLLAGRLSARSHGAAQQKTESYCPQEHDAWIVFYHAHGVARDVARAVVANMVCSGRKRACGRMSRALGTPGTVTRAILNGASCGADFVTEVRGVA